MIFWCHDQDVFCATWWTETAILDVEWNTIPDNQEIRWTIYGKQEIRWTITVYRTEMETADVKIYSSILLFGISICINKEFSLSFVA